MYRERDIQGHQHVKATERTSARAASRPQTAQQIKRTYKRTTYN